MQLSRTMPSLTATMPTSGTLYQQGCPRRVMLLSMMSSATRKYACSCTMDDVTMDNVALDNVALDNVATAMW